MEQHFKYVAQKVHYNKNPDTFDFAQHFNKNPTPQQCCEIMSLIIISTLNPIQLMKTWGKSSCKLFRE